MNRINDVRFILLNYLDVQHLHRLFLPLNLLLAFLTHSVPLIFFPSMSTAVLSTSFLALLKAIYWSLGLRSLTPFTTQVGCGVRGFVIVPFYMANSWKEHLRKLQSVSVCSRHGYRLRARL